MIDLQELSKQIDNKALTTRQILDYINDVITLKFKEPLIASRYLPLFGKYYLITHDNSIIKPLFYLCEEFRIFDNVIIQRYVSYTLFFIYYTLPHYPKAIEYGLELEKIGFNYPFMELNDYKFMSMMCFSLDLYDETISYNQKSLESVKKYFDTESEIYQTFNTVYLNNLVFIYSKRKNYLAASVNKDQLVNYLNNISNDEVRQKLTNFSSFTLMYFRFKFEKLDPKEYIDAVNHLQNNLQDYPRTDLTIAVHIELLELFNDSKFIIDVFKICHFLINCENLVGDKSAIYLKMFNLLEIYETDDQNALKAVFKEYRDISKEHYEYQSFISSIVAMENFKVSSIESRIQKVDDKASKDYLTGCYNRFVLANDWQEIYSKLPNGGTITFIDIDNLKYINDSYGHESGDEHINNIVSSIKKELQDTSRIYRYGGDEFIILSDQDQDTMNDLIDKVRSNCDKESYSSFSYGIVVFDKNSSFDVVLEEADKRMYEQKNNKKMSSAGVKFL